MTTKEKIMAEALNLFSTKGYDPVSVRDIAYAVGIKESSLYNHFRNKQDIFDSILKEYAGRWEAIFKQVQITDDDGHVAVDERTVNMYRNMTNQQFAVMAAAIFDYYMTDEVNVKLRRMLTIEQYRSDEIAMLFRKISFNESLDFQAQLFCALINQGCFIKTDPYILALEFFSPIFLIFYKYGNDSESLREAKTLFMRHIDHFNKIYGTNQTKEGRE